MEPIHSLLALIVQLHGCGGVWCVGANLLHDVYGVVKAYTTRVAAGAFPTELPLDLENSPGWLMSNVGAERGTTTGRIRRCVDGYFFFFLELNGLTGLCLTKMDVIDGWKKK